MRTIGTIRGYNLYGNILTGLCACALGFTWLLDKTGLSVPIAAVLLLISSAFSLAACLSHTHEQSDEMARVHEGVSSGITLKTLLLCCAVLCGVETVAKHTVPLAPACCLCIGLSLVCYGLVFDYLEQE